MPLYFSLFLCELADTACFSKVVSPVGTAAVAAASKHPRYHSVVVVVVDFNLIESP